MLNERRMERPLDPEQDEADQVEQELLLRRGSSFLRKGDELPFSPESELPVPAGYFLIGLEQGFLCSFPIVIGVPGTSRAMPSSRGFGA